MPTNYELWATQHALVDVQEVQVLEFQHPKWGSLFLCNYGKRFTGRTQAGADFAAEPVAFTVDLPAQDTTTQSQLTIRMDALGGYVISQIRAMTDAERAQPVSVIWHGFLDNAPTVPVFDPLTFVVVDLSATSVAVEFHCAVTIFPNVAAGIRYTLDNFPSLAYL